MKLHVKKNDMVVVISGEHKGKIGKVLASLPDSGRVIVEGVNTMNKAVRKSQESPKGGMITKEFPIPASKVMLQEKYDLRRKKRGGTHCGCNQRLMASMSLLHEQYKKTIVEEMMKSGRYTNRMQVPKVEKVVLNMGVNSKHDKDVINVAQAELATITGQKPIVTYAKKSIASFSVREGMAVGTKVTLRGKRMYEFLERFLHAALPRIRDFRGVNPRGFDGRGSYTLGVKDQTIFPEVELDKIKHNLGMDVTIVTTANTDAEAKELLKLLGMPFSS